jgi:hypothetical protein
MIFLSKIDPTKALRLSFALANMENFRFEIMFSYCSAWSVISPILRIPIIPNLFVKEKHYTGIQRKLGNFLLEYLSLILKTSELASVAK